jgi:succinyl-CoA synthetase alpha subunit
MGHAGAIISGSSGTAAEKIAAFEAAGIGVAQRPMDFVALLQKRLKSRRGPSVRRVGRPAIKKTAKRVAKKARKATRRTRKVAARKAGKVSRTATKLVRKLVKRLSRKSGRKH